MVLRQEVVLQRERDRCEGELADGYVSILAQCPKEGCDGDRAFFYMLQIRSADEPMTRFLKVCMSRVGWAGERALMCGQCTKCGNQWREN